MALKSGRFVAGMAMRANSLSTDRAPLHVSIDRSRSMDKTCGSQSATATFARLIRRGAVGNVSEGLQPLLPSSPVLVTEDESSAASAAREAFFQPKGLAWLDSCDEHRNEEVKQADAGIRSQRTLESECGFPPASRSNLLNRSR